MNTHTFDPVAFVMAYEEGELAGPEVLEGFGHMIASGLVWQMQGTYGLAAAKLIEAGLIDPDTGAVLV